MSQFLLVFAIASHLQIFSILIKGAKSYGGTKKPLELYINIDNKLLIVFVIL